MLESVKVRAGLKSPWKRLGKVKLGKTQRGNKLKCAIPNHAHTDECYWSFPVDCDHFVIPEQYKAKLGAEPKALDILLAFPTLEENFDTNAKLWGGNGAKKCWTKDGITAFRYMKGAGEKYDWMPMPCPGLNCEFRQKKQCAEKGEFSFMVPALLPEVGTLFMRLGSKVGIDNIYTALTSLQFLTRGRKQGMFGLRMKFTRERTEFLVDLKGDGQQSKIVKFIPTLAIDWEQLMAEDKNLLAPFFGQPLTSLPAGPVTVDELEEKDEDRDEDDDHNGGKS